MDTSCSSRSTMSVETGLRLESFEAALERMRANRLGRRVKGGGRPYVCMSRLERNCANLFFKTEVAASASARWQLGNNRLTSYAIFAEACNVFVIKVLESCRLQVCYRAGWVISSGEAGKKNSATSLSKPVSQHKSPVFYEGVDQCKAESTLCLIVK